MRSVLMKFFGLAVAVAMLVLTQIGHAEDGPPKQKPAERTSVFNEQ